MKHKLILAGLLPFILAGLPACTAVVATGATTGVALAHDRRTAGSVIEDESIELKALNAFMEDDELWKQSHLNITSYNGIVLLTGESPTPMLRATAERIAREIPKVRDVHNEITVAAPSSLLTRSSDSLITTRIKARMIGDEQIDPTRVKVITENGAVFLMGIVRRQEAELSTEIARETSGVQRVVKIFEYID